MALFPYKDEDAAAWAESSMGAPPIIEEYIFNKPISDVSLDKGSDNDATERVLKLEEIPSESFTAPAVVDWDAIANDVDEMLTKVYTTREDFGPGAPKNQAETRASKRYCDKEKNGGDEDATPGALLPKSLAPSSLSQPVYVKASPVCKLPEDSTSKDNITFSSVRRDTMQGDSRASLNHTQVFNMTVTPLMPGDGQGPMVITPTPTKDACKEAYQMECFTVDGEGPMSTQIGETPWQEVTGPVTDKPFSSYGHHSPPTVTAFAMVEQQLSAPEYMYSEAMSQASDLPVQEPWPQFLGPWYPHPLCPVHSPQHRHRGVLLNGVLGSPSLEPTPPESPCYASSDHSRPWTPELQYEGVSDPPSGVGFLPGHYGGSVPEGLWYAGWQRSTPYSADPGPQAWGGVGTPGNLWRSPQPIAPPALADPRLGAYWTTQTEMLFREPISQQAGTSLAFQQPSQDLMQQPTHALTAGVYRKSSESRSPHPLTELPSVPSNTESMPKWGRTITESGEVIALPQESSRQAVQTRGTFARPCDKSRDKGRRASRSPMGIKEHSRRVSVSHRHKTRRRSSLHGDAHEQINYSRRVSGASRRKSVTDREDRLSIDMSTDKWPGAYSLREPASSSHPIAMNPCTSKHHHPCHSTFVHRQHHEHASTVGSEAYSRCQSAPPFQPRIPKRACVSHHLCHHRCINMDTDALHASCSSAMRPTDQVHGTALNTKFDEGYVTGPAAPHYCKSPRTIAACSHEQIPVTLQVGGAYDSFVLPALQPPITRSTANTSPAREIASQPQVFQQQVSNADLYLLLPNVDGQEELYQARRVSPVLRLQKGPTKLETASKQPRSGATVESGAASKAHTRKPEVGSAPMTKNPSEWRRPSGRCSVGSSASSRLIFTRPKQQSALDGEGKQQETIHSEHRGSLLISLPRTISVKAAEIGEPNMMPTRQQPPPKLSSVRPSVTSAALDPATLNMSHVDAANLIEDEEKLMASKPQGVSLKSFSQQTELQEIHQPEACSTRPSRAAAALDASAPARLQKVPAKVLQTEEQVTSLHEQALPLGRVSEATKQDGNCEPESHSVRPPAQLSMAYGELDSVTSARPQDCLTEGLKRKQEMPSMPQQGLHLKRLSDETGRNTINQPEPYPVPQPVRPSTACVELNQEISAKIQEGPAKTVKAKQPLRSTSNELLKSKLLSETTGRGATYQPETYSVRPSMAYVGPSSFSSARLQDTLPEEATDGEQLDSTLKQERLHLKRLSQATIDDAVDQRELTYVQKSARPSVASVASVKPQSAAANTVKASKRLHSQRLSETTERDAIGHIAAEIATSLTDADQEFTKTSGRDTQSLKPLSTVPALNDKTESNYHKDSIGTSESPRASKCLPPPPEKTAQQAKKCISGASPDSVFPPKNKEISMELTPHTPFATPLQGCESNKGGDPLSALSCEYFSALKEQENAKESLGLRSPKGPGLASPRSDNDDAVDVRMTMAPPSTLDSETRRQPPIYQAASFYPEIRFAMIVSILCLMWMFAVYLLFRKVYTGKLAQKAEAVREPFSTVQSIPAAELIIRTTRNVATEPPVKISLCTTPLCVQEGHRLKRYITRERSPCSNFYRYVCKKEEMSTVRPLAGGASSSADTLTEESLAAGLREFILNERHREVTLVRALYKACVRPSGNTVAFLQKEVFATLPIRRWPYKGSFFQRSEIWRMAGMLIRRYGIASIMEVTVGAHRNGMKPTVELSYPRYLHLEEYSLSEVTDTLRSAVSEAAKELGSAEVDPSLDNLASQITTVVRSLANLEGNKTVWQVLFAKFEDLDDNVSLFLRSIFEDGVSEGTAVVIRNPRLLIDQLQALISSASVAAFANYLGFRILVYFAALFDPDRAKNLRRILSVELAGRVLPPKMDWLLCLRVVETVQPACLMKAQAMHQAAAGATTASRLWLARLEGQLYRNLPFISWLTDKSLKMLSHRLPRLHIVRFYEPSSSLWEDFCALNPSDKMNEGGSLQMFARTLGKYHRERLRQISKKTRPLSPGFAFNTDSRYSEAEQAVYVPVGLVNSSWIADSSLLAFHASRTAVRLYKGLLPVAYEQWDSNEDAESQWLLDAVSRRRLDSLLDCLERDFAALPRSLQPTFPGLVRDASEVRYPLLAQTAALALAFAAFKELLNADHNRQSDFRLQSLSAVSSEQLFFIYYALDNCERSDGQYQARQFRAWRRLAPEHRVNLPLRHLPQFARAFRCGVSDGSSSADVGDQPMAAPEKSRCDVVRWNMSLVHSSRRRYGQRGRAVPLFDHARLAGAEVNVPDSNVPTLVGSGEILERPEFPAPY